MDTQDSPTLRWTPGWKAARHDVYFGGDKEKVAQATTANADVYLGRWPAHATTAHPGVLAWGREYYWRVDEVNEAEAKSPWKGNLWRFATADFIPVDDFESYSDHDGDRIYEVWIDGWINGTGSTVGYLAAADPAAFVHRGAQSMPFDYNNAEPPYYSETQRTWSTPQDWTVHGADELSLWFVGARVSFQETPAGGIVLSGSGGDMECTYDPYRFAYKRLDGDGEISARIDSLSNARGWGRAGVMIADTPDGGSQYALAAITMEYGLLFANCPFNNTAGVRTLYADEEAPHWLKLIRTGSRLTARHSSDGVVWQDVADANGVPAVITMDLPREVYLGLCVASHKRDVIATAEFSDIRLAGSVSESWQVAEAGWDQPGNSRDDLYIALTDAQGRFAHGGASGPGRGQCRRLDMVGDPAEPFPHGRRGSGIDQEHAPRCGQPDRPQTQWRRQNLHRRYPRSRKSLRIYNLRFTIYYCLVADSGFQSCGHES